MAEELKLVEAWIQIGRRTTLLTNCRLIKKNTGKQNGSVICCYIWSECWNSVLGRKKIRVMLKIYYCFYPKDFSAYLSSWTTSLTSNARFSLHIYWNFTIFSTVYFLSNILKFKKKEHYHCYFVELPKKYWKIMMQYATRITPIEKFILNPFFFRCWMLNWIAKKKPNSYLNENNFVKRKRKAWNVSFDRTILIWKILWSFPVMVVVKSQ